MASLTRLFLLLLLSGVAAVFSIQCDKRDKKALLAVKAAWGNPSFLTWKSSTPCCGWTEIECRRGNGRVTHIEISQTDLIRGPIPAAMGDLSALEHLSLFNLPNLAGPVPPSLARLSNLTALSLSGNGLSGPVPSFFASLPKLVYISLNDNRLTGPIPPYIGTLRSPDHRGLQLDLSNNNLTGTVPRSLSLVHFEYLLLSGNRLTGDASSLFRDFTTKAAFKHVIHMARNSLDFDLGKVRFPWKLYSLDLSHNRIYGRIPGQIAKLPELWSLDVSHNRLCGKIPTGGQMGQFYASAYEGNPCLCGTPLPPCNY